MLPTASVVHVSSVELRPIAEADYEAIHELHLRSEGHDGVPRVLSMEELKEDLDGGLVDLAEDTRVAVLVDESGGRTLAGYAFTHHLPSEVRLERCYIVGQVEPTLRRQGIGRALMEWAVPRATDQLRSSGRELPRFVRVGHYDFQLGSQRLFETIGFVPVRYFVDLIRSLSDLPEVVVPDGINVIPWPLDRSEDIRQAKNVAFADHWGSTPQGRKGWELMIGGSAARLDVSFVATDEKDRVVGHCFNTRYEHDDETLGRREGWVANIGTLPEVRGRGVASALISTSLAAFAAQGWTHAALDVDGDSPTGAFRLYRSLGFEPSTRSITYEIAV